MTNPFLRTKPHHIRPIFPPLAVAAEVTHRRRQSALPISTEEVRERLFAVLSADEVGLLARYLFDSATQQEISDATGVPRRTVAHRIRHAIQKLEHAGINVVTPGKGRRKERPKLARCGQTALDQLATTDVPGAGFKRGRWIKSRKTAKADAEFLAGES